MDMDAKVYELPVLDSDLVEHRAHLPEVADCKRCGYVRDKASADAVLVPATV